MVVFNITDDDISRLLKLNGKAWNIGSNICK